MTDENKKILHETDDLVVYVENEDTDAGEWKSGVKRTSWYNDEASKGLDSKGPNFPERTLVIAADDGVTIYDADDLSAPPFFVPPLYADGDDT